MQRAVAVPLVLLLALPAVPAQGDGGAQGRDALALAVAEDVRGDDVYARDAALTLDPGTAHRLVGTPTHDNARAWVEGQFRDLGLEPREFAHGCSGPNGVVAGGVAVRLPGGQHVPVPAASVLALLPGKSATRWVVVGGHFDTQETSPGALDNGAGVAMVLTLAQAFARHRETLDAGVLFVAWDCEEWGVWGSKEFVARLPEVEAMYGLAPGTLRILAAVGLDMPGLNWPAQDVYPTYHKGAFSVMHVRTSPVDTFGYKSSYGEYNRTNYTGAQLAGFRHFRDVVKHAAFDLLDYPPQWVWVEDDTHGRTDHVPFVAHGIPGMRVHGPSDEEYPPYHGPADTMPVLEQSAGGKDKLLAGMESAARLTAVAVALMMDSGPGDVVPAASPAGGARVPGFETGLAAVALAALALAARRRA
jgi:hypothetical protein